MSSYFTKNAGTQAAPELTAGHSYAAQFQVNGAAVAFDGNNNILVYGGTFLYDLSSASPGTVVQTYATMLRFTPNSALDTSFGAGGVVAMAFDPAGASYPQKFEALLVRPDGEILAAGAKTVYVGLTWENESSRSPGLLPSRCAGTIRMGSQRPGFGRSDGGGDSGAVPGGPGTGPRTVRMAFPVAPATLRFRR